MNGTAREPSLAAGERAGRLNDLTSRLAEALQSLALHGDDSRTRKEARRALYLLKTIRVAPAGARTAAPPTRIVRRAAILGAYAAGVAAAHRLYLFISTADPDGGRATLAGVAIALDRRVMNLWLERIAPSKLPDAIAKAAATFDGTCPFAEIEPDYALALIARAHAGGRAVAARTPPGFLDWVAALGAPVNDWEAAPVYRYVSPRAALDDPSIDHDAARFLGRPWFESWYPPFEALESYLKSWSTTLKGSLTVPASVREEQLRRLVVDATPGVLNAQTCADLAHDLEVTGYLLWRANRATDARESVYHAATVARDGAEAQFARAYVERELRRFAEHVAAQAEAGD